MRARSRAHRPRIVVANARYAADVPVREVLEDKGFEVVAQPPPRFVLAEVAEHRPEAVLLDDELVDHRPPNTIANIRAVSPETRVIVFTSSEATIADLGADGTVGKFAPPNGELTGLLTQLVGEPTARPARRARRDRTAAPRRQRSAPLAHPETRRRFLGAAAVVVAGALLMWSAFSAGDRPVEQAPPSVADGSTEAPPAVVVEKTALDRAFKDLRHLRYALTDGNYVLARAEARALTDHRQQALRDGLGVHRLDVATAAMLSRKASDLPPRADSALREILGRLMPAEVTREAKPARIGGVTNSSPTGTGSQTSPGTGTGSQTGTGAGGGGDTTTGGGSGGGGGDTTTGGGGSGGGGGTGGGGTGGGGDTTTGGGGTGGGGTGGGGDTGGGTGGGTVTNPPSNGNGNANGADNRPPDGGWHGENPQANGGGNGNANGHAK